MSYGLYRRFLIELSYIIGSVEKCIPSGLIHAKETAFSAKRKVVKDN